MGGVRALARVRRPQRLACQRHGPITGGLQACRVHSREARIGCESHSAGCPKMADAEGMMPGAYQLVAIRGEVEVFRAGFDDRDEAYRAFADALVRYPDCEVRLTSGGGVLISAGPAPTP